MSREIWPPALGPQHIGDARVFADRNEMVKSLFRDGADRICEIGVAYGDFSDFLILTLRPTVFAALDTFDMHLMETSWGRPTAEKFQGKTHLEFYKQRLSGMVRDLIVLEGASNDTLSTLPDEFFDMIYVDAAHTYDEVKKDGLESAKKVKASGVLIFNDYTMYDPSLNVSYGVVQAVNEIVTQSDWKVIGIALQQHMFCDIALRRG